MTKNILIVSNNVLSVQNNNGKTLLSFFKGFEKKNLAQLYFSDEEPEGDFVSSYYNFNDRDALLSVIKASSLVGYERNYSNKKKERVNSGTSMDNLIYLKNFKIIRLAREIIWKLSKKNEAGLKSWVEKFSPDIIFFCAGDSVFAYDLYQKLCHYVPEAKKVVYITDDYITARPSLSLSWWLRRKMVRQRMRQAVRDADNFITISDEMRSEYRDVFGVDSVLAFNVASNLRVGGFKKTERNDFILVYAGGLHFDRWRTLSKLGSEIDYFNVLNKRSVRLKIFSHQYLSRKVLNSLTGNTSTIFCGSLDEEGVKFALNDADILVHVESFSKKNRRSTRLSLSTKIPEYVSVGRPILAIGPSELASMKFLSTGATCITSIEDLRGQLHEILSSDHRDGNGGGNLAERIDKVREEFDSFLSGL